MHRFLPLFKFLEVNLGAGYSEILNPAYGLLCKRKRGDSHTVSSDRGSLKGAP